MPNRNKICNEWGIKLKGRRSSHPKILPAKQCHSGQTIFDIAERGETLGEPGHIHDVLFLMLSSEVNQRMLYRDCIVGVSTYLIRHKLFGKDVALLQDRFAANVNLEEIRADVIHYKIHERPIQIALLIAVGMEG